MPHARLSPSTLSSLKPPTRRFTYTRDRLEPGIVHLGLGAFFRAHAAEYTEDVLEADFGAWGIIGASLKRPDQRDLLKPQSGLYTLLNRAPEGESARVIGSVLDVLVAPEDPVALIARMADPATRIVSLTVTEKGYCHNPASGRLDATHPDIRHDLENPKAPRSAIGFIVAALARRNKAGLAPFTVLCCDNLPNNGALVSRLVADFASLRKEALACWIEQNGAFPATMVDRIVPASTEADLATALRLTGLEDRAAIAHEPFRQWVIEDNFVDDLRPRWEMAGAQMVQDVTAFEHMKLRLLNASHSALAYLGYLSGQETIGDAARNPVLRAYVERLWRDEIIPVVPPPPGTDLAAYARALLTRYDNPAIRHRTWQIAMDGSQKLPQRLLATVRDRLSHGQPVPLLAHAVAGWMRYVGGADDAGKPIDVRDPLAAEFRNRTRDLPLEQHAEALLAMPQVFGEDLPQNAGFVSAVRQAYAAVATLGAAKATEKLIAG